ncbi:MAG: methyl-accepting chemotaxis protein [Pseudomonadota bacterium]
MNASTDFLGNAAAVTSLGSQLDRSGRKVVFGLAYRLALLLLLFALAPTALIGISLWQATDEAENQRLETNSFYASKIAENIDRKLADRYKDVQAFALSAPVDAVENDLSRLIDVMNGYVAQYELYPLTIFADTSGVIQAVNTLDASGSPLGSFRLIGSDVSSEAWFQRAKARDYTTRQPFTGPGNDGADGTVVVDLNVDERVKEFYPSHSGAVFGFAAPVERNGRTVGYWYNMVDLSSVEEIYENTYQSLKASGYGATELTLLDGDGTIIVDFDPTLRGSESVSKTDAFMSLNLASGGVEAAKLAVSGKSGALYAQHTRKQIVQAAGYAHLQGAQGFPGMNWSVLVRTPKSVAAAVPNATRKLLITQAVVIAVLAVIAGFFVGRYFASPLVQMAGVTQRIASGDLSGRVEYDGSSEIGQVARSINSVRDYLNQAIASLARNSSSLDQSAVKLASQTTTINNSASDSATRAANVAAAAGQMTGALESVSQSAEESSEMIKSVANGAEEMASTIREIAQSSERARTITSTAVGNASAANDRVEELAQASDEISRVIDVILEIAEQTKLLALNATIEAARAGEAGKGFAVVASEVKDLAQQTNTATEEIRAKIEAIQGSTGATVEEIGSIRSVIGEVSDIVQTIAAAVEEQSATTQSMAGDVSSTAQTITGMSERFAEVTKSSSEIASDISQVTQQIQDIDDAATEVEDEAAGLASSSNDLKSIVDQFRVAD